MVKPYLQEHPDTQNPVSHDSQDPKPDPGQCGEENNNGDDEIDIDAPGPPRQNAARTHRLPARFQHMADISILLQSDASQPPFTESRRKKINRYSKKVPSKLLQSRTSPAE